MASGGSAIRGSRVGAGPMGEQDRGYHADRIQVSYWDEMGNETVRNFAANLPDDEIPETIDSPSTGLPAGRDKDNPPSVSKLEPYKTHLAYVKERRTEEEAASLLDEALVQLRQRRGSLHRLLVREERVDDGPCGRIEVGGEAQVEVPRQLTAIGSCAGFTGLVVERRAVDREPIAQPIAATVAPWDAALVHAQPWRLPHNQ